MRKYNHKKIERKWQKAWAEEGIYRASETARKPSRYILDMFPYPSGEGLHVGHPKGYIGTDIYSRYLRMTGYNVLHPMGWDAFGLPAENYAIKHQVHPRQAVKKNIGYYKRQLTQLGLSFDWSRELNTTDPEYYRWTQWIFLQMFHRGLAYQSFEPINWCPSCQTGLANEDLEDDGTCERCGSVVEQRPMRQWVLRITDYADQLLEGLEGLDWPESVKESQRNWIGRSEGAEFNFPVAQKDHFVLLHGYSGSPKRGFFPWLKRELEARGHTVEAPELPTQDGVPDIEEQVKFVRENCHFNEHTIVIGHSLGGVVANKVVEKLKAPVKKLVLAASTTAPVFKDRERPFAGDFDWRFDFDRVRKNTRRVVVLRDRNDPVAPEIEADKLSEATGGELTTVTARDGHFTSTHEPAVLEAALEEIKVFTTRPDTIYGATYMVLAPEHPLVEELRPSIKNWSAVSRYRSRSRQKTERQRLAEESNKTGVQLEGVNAVNPANGEEIPVYVADYVLIGYGTGAIMAVPAHDERDHAFARKFGLPIRQVIRPVQTDEKNPPQKNFKNETRHSIIAIVKHPTENKVLTLNWKNQDWRTFVIGGIEKGEDALSAAKREIREETGYSDLYFEGQLGQEVRTHFHAPHKGVNRDALTQVLVFKLNSFKQEKVSEEELAKHTPEWSNWNIIPELTHSERYLIDHWLKTGNHAYTGEGELINSGEWNTISSEHARKKITEAVGGVKRVSYRLKDWVFSRQRYWGEPIPLIHCSKCGVVPVPESDLPVKLPAVKSYEPTGTGESPLAAIESWVKTKCPRCGGPGRRETNTMPQWAGSCWYYIAYCLRQNSRAPSSKSRQHSDQFLKLDSEKAQSQLRRWLPVDMYVGGIEHATRHLIYARFWHKFLYDLGVTPSPEPFKKLKNQGMIAGPDGQKMSKSKGNVVSPDEVVNQFGADSFRVYTAFMGPFEQGAAWSSDSAIGARRFLERVWKLQAKIPGPAAGKTKSGSAASSLTAREGSKDQDIEASLHRAIKKVTEDVETFNFNTAVAALMTLVNDLERVQAINKDHYKVLLRLLAPFAPHLTEELWSEVFGYRRSIHQASWPSYDPAKLRSKTTEIVVQVNGKVRDQLTVPAEIGEAELTDQALKRAKIHPWIQGQQVVRTVVVPGKLVNIVVRPK